MRVTKRGLRPLVVLPLLAVLGACGLAGTNEGGYIEGDGNVVTYAVDHRGDAIELTGKTLQGKAYDLADQRGKVVVVNVWGAWCGECIKEAPLLKEAQAELAKQYGDKVTFVGIDVRDSVGSALAFERGNGIDYPSIDGNDGKALRSFTGKVSPRTTPATMVLDKQGRVAATINGAVPSKLTLVETVQDVETSS